MCNTKPSGRISPYNRRFCTPEIQELLCKFVGYRTESMSQIITYLNFNGCCKEAMEFYQDCIGGELNFQTLSESPEGHRFPEAYQKWIVQASLKKGNLLLLATDLHHTKTVTGNAISIMLTTKEPGLIKSYFDQLKRGAVMVHPLKRNYWGVLSGDLTDKYGNHWLFHCKQNTSNTSTMNNKEIVTQLVNAFLSQDLKRALPYMADDIQMGWPGYFDLKPGKDAFQDFFKNAPEIVAGELDALIEENNTVVAQGRVSTKHQDGSIKNCFFSDVYQIENGKVKSILSYVVFEQTNEHQNK